jgi:hypothetical protein
MIELESFKLLRYFRQNNYLGTAVVNDYYGNPINGGPWCITSNCMELGGLLAINGQFNNNISGNKGNGEIPEKYRFRLRCFRASATLTRQCLLFNYVEIHRRKQVQKLYLELEWMKYKLLLIILI